jgi:hypothetical protein
MTGAFFQMLGLKLEAEVRCGRLNWPDKPRGNLFQDFSEWNIEPAHKKIKKIRPDPLITEDP